MVKILCSPLCCGQVISPLAESLNISLERFAGIGAFANHLFVPQLDKNLGGSTFGYFQNPGHPGYMDTFILLDGIDHMNLCFRQWFVISASFIEFRQFGADPQENITYFCSIGKIDIFHVKNAQLLYSFVNAVLSLRRHTKSTGSSKLTQ